MRMANTTLTVYCVLTCLLMEDLAMTQQVESNTFSRLFSVLPKMRTTKEIIRDTKKVAPELFIRVEEDVRSRGYPIETHKVHTEDGYILTLHRIPRGLEDQNETDAEPNPQTVRPPVLLQHGMMSHSDYWVFNGFHSPGYMLADRGYDVWMNNLRGSMYSLEHGTLDRDDPRFWKFSWHEGGYYDIPAVIDYILNVTGQEKLFYFGHSMGNLMFYVALSLRPEYNDKVRLQIALAPAVYFDNCRSLAIRSLYPDADIVKVVMNLLPRQELNVHTDALLTFNHLTCSDAVDVNNICPLFLSVIWGTTNPNIANFTQILARAGGSTSTYVLLHYSQIILGGEVRMMNYGKEKNTAKYGTGKPPKYPLHKVIVPVAIYGAKNDFLVPLKGLNRLSKVLPNVVSYNVIEEEFFNHIDFTAHPLMNELLWDDIFEIMKRY